MKELNLTGTKSIETERLILRKFKESDGDSMYRNWASSEAVTRYVTWSTHASPTETRDLCRMWEEKSQSFDYFNWLMVLKENNEPIGNIEVVYLNKSVREAHIGYCMSEKWWNMGFMTECFSAVIAFLFEEVGINRISAGHHTENPASGRVMQKCGLRFEGILRQSALLKGQLCDIAHYAILYDDYISK